jgi:hypothetical protein
MSIVLNGTTGITTPTYGGAVAAEYIAPVTSFKNRIINGAMQIDQRNAGASVNPAAGVQTYTVDRWASYFTQTSKLTVQQNAGAVTPPTGFTSYLGFTSSSSYSVLSSDTFLIEQAIEGFNVADLAWGTANAQTITISFWVRSSLTGTFGGALRNGAINRSYVFSYTISAANTWEQKTVTIAGDTTGTWITNNGTGIVLRFGLGSGATFSGTAGSWAAGNLVQSTGSVSVVGTNGATFYITGVQLEKGSTATSFDYRPYGTELALCQRYYYQSWGSGTFSNVGNNYSGMPIPNTLSVSIGTGLFPVSMRASPTITLYDNVGASGKVSQPGLADALISTASSIGNSGFTSATKTTTAYTTGYPVNAGFIASIEL